MPRIMNVAILVVMLVFLGCSRSTEQSTAFTTEQEYLFHIFETRRSVRGYKPDPVPEEHLTKILDMARTAPTAGNQQPWKFLVITERKRIDALNQATADYYIDYFRKERNLAEDDIPRQREQLLQKNRKYLDAPVFIVVLTDSRSKYPDYNKWDGSLAAGYLILAARALGYGTVFCTDSFPFKVIREVFGIPERYDIVCSTPLGIPQQWPSKPDKKALGEFIVYEKIGDQS